MSWPLLEWQAEAERLGGRFWQPATGRRIARAYFGGTTYVEVDLFLDKDEINELIVPRISLPRNAINAEALSAANELAKWRPTKMRTNVPETVMPAAEPPKPEASRDWLWVAALIAVLACVAYGVATAAERQSRGVYGICPEMQQYQLKPAAAP